MEPKEIVATKEKALQEAEEATSLEALEAVRIRYLGRKGILPSIMAELGKMSPEMRAEAGKAANALKEELSALLRDKKMRLEEKNKKRDFVFDYTLPGNWRGIGTKHPISSIIDEVIRIFGQIGFVVADGPDIETSYHNFEALNTPAHHPSLDESDTFWLEDGRLLRTQTSPVQIRVMEKHKPPVRIITPGRCYRRDTMDATHSANFHQVEGLYVDKKVSMADLKGTLSYFVGKLMGASVELRFRPHFFPFTEPSVECDFSCHMCGGKGCRVCKNSGWIEIAGAGMVDPRVFAKVGYPDDITGFAFGMGIERIAMVKYGIEDIRLLYENDARFLSQFA